MNSRRLFSITLLVVSLLTVARGIAAQSSDQGLPTPVLTNEIKATIAPLDLGDSRSTRHYYAFEGTPGDLIITLSSRNLNGDMDIFTAATFKPLMKISIFANTIPPAVTKSIYLRTKQILILRVEARTPSDESGSYRVDFSGAFAPFSGGIPVAENSEPSSDENRSGSAKTKRLSSAGARIEEAVAETSPTPEPVAAKPVEEKPVEETTAAKTRAKPKSARTSPRNTRVRPPRSTRSKPAEKETPMTVPTPSEAAENAKEGAEKPAPAKPESQEPALPEAGAHLIIESKDGTKIDRPMSTVRRVVVEGGTIVIVLKTGRIERVPMSGVARMSIEP